MIVRRPLHDRPARRFATSGSARVHSPSLRARRCLVRSLGALGDRLGGGASAARRGREMIADRASASMETVVRPATLTDAEMCGRICYEGFKALNERHGFPPNYPSVDAATARVRALLEHPAVFGVVATERGGGVLGFNFLSERDPIRAVGPIVVDPAAQGRGVGRQLMTAALDRAASAPGVRLAQEAFNLGSLALYAGLGFEAKEPLVALTGRPSRATPWSDREVRPLREEDLAACATLHEQVHGHSRANELREALARGLAWVALHEGLLWLTPPW